MDVILQRFPVSLQDIFKQLNDKSLANCREVSKIFRNFLDNDSLLWRRRIQKYDKNQTEFQEAWKLVTTKVPIEKLREIALAVEKFYKLDLKEELENQHSPLHIGAAIGNISICEYIVERTRMVNPARIHGGQTPLHCASLQVTRVERRTGKDRALAHMLCRLRVQDEQSQLPSMSRSADWF